MLAVRLPPPLGYSLPLLEKLRQLSPFRNRIDFRVSQSRSVSHVADIASASTLLS